jgi:alkylation response protein AidB-like acyl-CoA dehydrogenase
MTFSLSDEVESLRGEAVRFATDVLAPRARQAERDGCWPSSVLEVLRRFSLREADVPVRLGGLEVGCVTKVVLLEALAGGDAGGLLAADQPGLSAGALEACPDARLASEIARACLAGEAQAALVVLDAEAAGPARIEWAPAWPALRWAWLSQGDELRLVELTRAPEPTAALAFHASGGVSVPLGESTVLGTWQLEPGAGVRLRGHARLHTAAMAVGIAQAAFDATIAYTTDRIVFGKPVAHHQGNAFELAAAATQLHGSRLLLRDAAAGYDRGAEDAGFWATEAWLQAIDAAVSISDLGIQLLGGHGFLVDHLAEKRFREVRMVGLLAGGRDAAEADVAGLVLSLPDPLELEAEVR